MVAAPAAAPPRSSITKRKYAILVADGTAAADDDTDTLTTLSPPTSTPPTIAPAPMGTAGRHGGRALDAPHARRRRAARCGRAVVRPHLDGAVTASFFPS